MDTDISGNGSVVFYGSSHALSNICAFLILHFVYTKKKLFVSENIFVGVCQILFLQDFKLV